MDSAPFSSNLRCTLEKPWKIPGNSPNANWAGYNIAQLYLH